MKKTLLISTLLLTVMFSSTSFSGLTVGDENNDIKWTKVGKNGEETIFYVDFLGIRKTDENVYWWDLRDFLKPMINATMSGKLYNQGDCKLNRYKVLSDSLYKEPMGRGEILSGSNVPDKEWRYPSLNSMNEVILKKVCSR